MKSLSKYIIIGLTIFSISSAEAQYYLIGRADDVQKFINQTKYDTTARIERLAALEFHRLLNEYRKSKNLDTAEWNEIFWITCRNHSIYMIVNNDLTHSQIETMKYFSGKSPGNRLDYVQEKEKKYSWSGENALYNFSCSGRNIEEKARNIAKSSFEQWKGSPGHNANMLNAGHKEHGVAFIIDDYKVYAASLFGYENYNYASNNSSTVTEDKSATTISIKPDNKTASTLNLNALKKAMESAVLIALNKSVESQKIVQDKDLLIAAKKHTEYMAANNVTEHFQKRNKQGYFGKTTAQRIARAKGDMFWFLKNQTSANEYLCFFEINELISTEEVLISKIVEELIQNNLISQSNLNKSAVSVKIKKKKGKIFIWATLIVD